MKKFVISFLVIVVAAALVFGTVLGIQYLNTNESVVPKPLVHLQGVTLSSTNYQWHQPVMGGILTRSFTGGNNTQPTALPTWKENAQTPIPLVLPEGYTSAITLANSAGESVYSGSGEGWHDIVLVDGTYSLDIFCAIAKVDEKAYGTFTFNAVLNIENPPPPTPEVMFTPGRLQLEQGEILSLKISHLPSDVIPLATTELGMSVFAPLGNGEWRALVPVGNQCPVGEYLVSITAGELAWQVTASITEFDFDVQNLEIDLTAPNISEANSAEAYKQFNNTIPPLWNTADNETYWEGIFIQPVQGRISTQFGEIRYTNGDLSTSRAHWGMDIAAAEGTPISAPGNGRVVFASYLLNTGNTVVIEHGGGLKSYYYHMSTLEVEAEQMVQQGDPIGAIGTTGYSTGPHLHFEMRIGRNAISPSMLFDENAGLYSADLAEQGALAKPV